MNIDKIEDRCYDRVADRIPDDSPLKGDDGSILCPWCQRPMRVRFSTLGHIYGDDDRRARVDGIGMKCAGDEGCGYRPDFDVPITNEVYKKEMELRDGQKAMRMGTSAESDEEVEQRLKDLGYIVE